MNLHTEGVSTIKFWLFWFKTSCFSQIWWSATLCKKKKIHRTFTRNCNGNLHWGNMVEVCGHPLKDKWTSRAPGNQLTLEVTVGRGSIAWRVANVAICHPMTYLGDFYGRLLLQNLCGDFRCLPHFCNHLGDLYHKVRLQRNIKFIKCVRHFKKDTLQTLTKSYTHFILMLDFITFFIIIILYLTSEWYKNYYINIISQKLVSMLNTYLSQEKMTYTKHPKQANKTGITLIFF